MRRIYFLFLIVAACENNNPAAVDMAMSNTDLSGDASMCTEGDACDTDELCKAGACVSCVDTTDDTACDNAYGEPGMHFICKGGACVVGCRGSTAAECGGKICGITTSNLCGNCSTDAQCVMALGSGHICNVATGNCVTDVCPTAGITCTANPADICCASSSDNLCFTGDCCSNTDCGDAGKSCVNHVCTNCPAPTGNVLYVDPSEVAGGAPTGADVPGCRFKRITDAMNVAIAGDTIRVLGTQTITGNFPCTNNTVECWPIAVKGGVHVTGASPSPAPVIRQDVSGRTAFTLADTSSRLSNLIIDGADSAGTDTGAIGVSVIVAASPTPSPAPAIDHVTVRNFTTTAIRVEGNLDVNHGTVLTSNNHGLTTANDGAVVRITGGADLISFSSNSGYGLRVQNGAVIAVGTPGINGAGNVVFNSNMSGGIDINGAAGTTDAFKVTLNGVVIWSNTGDGLRITPVTPLSIRNSYILQNTGSGVHVSAGTVGGLIELGTDTTTNAGRNTLQHSDAANNNDGAGICTDSTDNIQAQGNIFSGPRDCTGGTPGNAGRSVTCTSAVDVGETSTGNFTLTNCNP